MTSLVERLRNNAPAVTRPKVAEIMTEAADTIEALCEALEVAMGALAFEGCCGAECVSCADARELIAKATS